MTNLPEATQSTAEKQDGHFVATAEFPSDKREELLARTHDVFSKAALAESEGTSTTDTYLYDESGLSGELIVEDITDPNKEANFSVRITKTESGEPGSLIVYRSTQTEAFSASAITLVEITSSGKMIAETRNTPNVEDNTPLTESQGLEFIETTLAQINAGLESSPA